MAFSLQNLEYEKIKIMFKSHTNLLTNDFELRMKKAISVLHLHICGEHAKKLKLF